MRFSYNSLIICRDHLPYQQYLHTNSEDLIWSVDGCWANGSLPGRGADPGRIRYHLPELYTTCYSDIDFEAPSTYRSESHV